MRDIKSDIKTGSYKRFYLFFGEERFMSIYMKNILVNSLVEKDDLMNKKIFDESSSLEDILSFCMSYPFMAEKKVAVIFDSGLFSKQSNLADKLTSIPDTSILIFIESVIDKRNKLYKLVEREGRAKEFTKMNKGYLRTYVRDIVSQKGISIDEDAVDIIIENSSRSMFDIKNELDKVISFCILKGSITAEDCISLESPNIEGKVFDMIDALVTGDKKKTIELYQNLLELREPPVKILALIIRQFNIMLQIKMCDFEGKSAERTLAMQSWMVSKYRKCSKNYDVNSLEDILERLVSTDYSVKTGMISDYAALDIVVTNI